MQCRSRSDSPAAGAGTAAVKQQRRLAGPGETEDGEISGDTRASSPSRELNFDRSYPSQMGQSPLYHSRSQTIIFFDWDDTLYPTSEILDKWGLNFREIVDDLTPKQQELVEDWASALYDYIMEACRLAAQVVIVTNSKTPWVITSLECLVMYCPKLLELFSGDRPGLKVVYAIDEVNRSLHAESYHCTPKKVACAPSPAEEVERLTNAKYFVMNKEVKAFYSQYAQQTWKNILSLGDMHYEHDAIQEVTFNRSGPPCKIESVRTKAIVLPTEPSLSEITMRLRFSKLMLPAYIAFDGDLDLDLRAANDPLLEIAKGLGLPSLADIHFSRHAWGREDSPALDEDKAGMLEAVAQVVRTRVSL